MSSTAGFAPFSVQVYTWRTAAIGLWSSAAVVVAGLAWSLSWGTLVSLRPWEALSPIARAKTWGLLLLLAAACGPLVFIHGMLVRTSEPMPLQHASNGPAAVLLRTLGRLRTAPGALNALTFIGSSMACGAVFMAAFPALRGVDAKALGWTLGAASGAILGLVHSCKYLMRSRDVLSFPVIQRPRIFRVKQRLLPAVAVAARTSASALVCCVSIQWMLPSSLQAATMHSSLVILTGMSLLATCWEAVATMTDIVFTESLSFGTYGGPNPLSTLLAAVKANKQPVMQELALMDVCLLTEQSGSSWLRSAVFADQAGTTWAAVIKPCLDEIQQLTSAIVGALPQQAGGAQAGSKSGKEGASTVAKWNAAPRGAKIVAGVPANRLADVAWHIRSRHHRIELCVRALSALVAASRKEDSFGVAQLRQPSIGDCVVTLLSALGALRQYVKLTCNAPSTHSPWALHGAMVWIRSMASSKAAIPSGALSMQEVDAAAYSLEDIVRTGVSRLGCTFDDLPGNVLKTYKAPTPYGSRTDLEAWLHSCLQGPF